LNSTEQRIYLPVSALACGPASFNARHVCDAGVAEHEEGSHTFEAFEDDRYAIATFSQAVDGGAKRQEGGEGW
jgi:hypothetical protein